MSNVKYCMDVWCGFSIRVEMDGLSTLRLVRGCTMGMHMAPQTHAMVIFKGLTCQPSVRSLATTMVYFCSLCAMDSHGKLS